MPNTVLVDGSNIARANDAGPKLTVGNMNTQAIYGTMRAVRAMVSEHREWNIVVLWDGRAQWRFDIYPDYKGNRVPNTPQEEADDANYKKQIPIIRKMLQLLGVHQMLVLDQEADDMAGYLTGRLTNAGNRVLLVSGDQDWLQLVNPLCRWLAPVQDRRVNHTNFLDHTGYFDTRAFLEGKAMIGDTSDNIQGVLRIGEGTAPKILAQFKSVDEFYRQVESGEFVPKLVVHKNLASEEGRAIFARNMKLMNLIDAPAPVAAQTVRLKPEFRPDHFRALCEKLNFRSVLRDFDNFVRPFQDIGK